MEKLKKNKGITLVALVVTVIILLILAGITIFMLGEHGIIKKAEQAGKDYKQAEVNEQKDLEELYASILVAGDSQVTLTMEQLDQYIEKKINEKSFIQANLIKAPVIVETTTTWTSRNIDVVLENSIEEYNAIQFTFGSYNNETSQMGVKVTSLIPVDQVQYGESAQKGAQRFSLSANEGGDWSACDIFFKDNKTLTIRMSAASNTGRKNFAISSIKGIK